MIMITFGKRFEHHKIRMDAENEDNHHEPPQSLRTQTVSLEACARLSFAEVLAWAGDSLTKPRQGSSSVHPFAQGRTAIQANPFAVYI